MGVPDGERLVVIPLQLILDECVVGEDAAVERIGGGGLVDHLEMPTIGEGRDTFQIELPP